MNYFLVFPLVYLGFRTVFMRLLKVVLLTLWVVATTLFIVGSLTPLEFRSNYVGYASFFIAFNGAFLLRFLLTNFISFKPSRALIALLLSLILAGTYTYLPGVNQDWKTQEILYRQKNNPDNVIAFQMEDKGKYGYGHRTVKMIRITPAFDWITELTKVKVNNDWVKVNEYVNEMGMHKRE